MDFLDKLAVVVELAAQIEDLGRREARALIDVAHHVDKARNRNVVTNRRFATAGARGGGSVDSVLVTLPSRLARLVGCDKPDCRVCTKEIVLDPDVVPVRTLPCNLDASCRSSGKAQAQLSLPGC